MTDYLEYKRYQGSVRYSAEDEVLFGRIEFIRDLVTYEGDDAKSLKKAFEEAVDDYLALCADEDREPDTPFKGSFNVRTGPDLHRKTALHAREHGKTLNMVVVEALKEHVEG